MSPSLTLKHLSALQNQEEVYSNSFPLTWKAIGQGEACSDLFTWALMVPGGSDGKDSSYNAGDRREAGSIPGSGRSPGERIDSPLQYSCLENSMDRGAWWATVHGVTKSWTQLSN